MLHRSVFSHLSNDLLDTGIMLCRGSICYEENSEDFDPGTNLKVLVPHSTLSLDAQISYFELNEDENLLSYEIQIKDDWDQIRFVEVPTGKQLADELEFVKYTGVTFSTDSKGVFYNVGVLINYVFHFFIFLVILNRFQITLLYIFTIYCIQGRSQGGRGKFPPPRN